jgi:hypothetical protein
VEEREAKKCMEAAEKIARVGKKKVDHEIAWEVKAQAKIEAAEVRKANAAAKKAATVATKAVKTTKPSQVIILKVGSMILNSLGSEDQVEIEEVTKGGDIVSEMTRWGRKIQLPVRLWI